MPPIGATIAPLPPETARASDTDGLLRALPQQLPIVAAALAGRIRLRQLLSIDGWVVERQNANASVFADPNGRRVHIFAIGAIVIEGLEHVDDETAGVLANLTGRALDRRTEETISLHFDSSKNARSIVVEWDRVVLSRSDPALVDAVAHLLAQSVALERYERVADAIVEETMTLAGEFAVEGRPPYRKGLPIRRVASLAVQRLELARWFFPLDRPEWAWEDEEIDRLYDALFDNLELHDRHEALQHKLASVESTLQVVIDLWSQRRSRSLEWAIVLLIVLEIVLAVLQVH